MEQEVLAKNYISVKDGLIKTHGLANGILVENQTIQFNNTEPTSVTIDLMMEQADIEMTYEFDEGVDVEIIERRFNTQTRTLKRHITVGKDAHVAMLMMNESTTPLIVEDHVLVKENAHVESAYAELSLSDVKGKYFYHLVGMEANVEIKMAALSSKEYKKTFEVSLLHSARMTYGQMSNYGVVKDSGTLVFDGIGKIERGFSQSSTHQTSKIMVFDNQCVAKANPYLYIDEYDVNASHAAGVGRMDEEHLFYLQSRGLTKNEAMQLITYGYLIPVVDVIDNETVKKAFNETLEKRMGD